MISLVIPTFNEKANIGPVADQAAEALAASGETFEIIVVDDSSPDGTAAQVQRLQAGGRPWLRLICRPRDLSTAVITGWRQSRGDLLACMDADFQHPPATLTAMVRRQIETRADVVVASRYATAAITRASALRRLLTRAAARLASGLLPGALTGLTDPMSGFFLFRRSAVDLSALQPRGYKLLIEILARCRPLRVVEVPFRFARRQAGRSKAGFGVTAQFLRQLIALAAAAGELRKMACFAAVGLSGVAVNFAAFASLRHLGVALAPAAALACAVAIANNFTGNELVTFRAAAQAVPGARAVTRRFLRFFAFSLIGLGLDTAAVAMLTPEIGWVLALALGIGLAASWNFAANATLTWPAPAPAPSRPVAPKAVAVAAEPLRVAAKRLSRPILEGPAASGACGWASPTGNGRPLALRASPGCRE